MFKPTDITGKKFYSLNVVSFSHKKNGNYFWNCKCDCGVEKVINRGKLNDKGTKSCGCQTKKINSLRTKTHGLSKTRIYRIWNCMIMRCYNPRREAYKNYGGRGIKVCDSWRIFENFRKDMIESYNDIMTLERNDVNGDYCIENCKWITFQEQAKNRRNTIVLVINNEEISVKDATEKYNLTEFKIYDRRRKGFSDYECVFGRERKIKKSPY